MADGKQALAEAPEAPQAFTQWLLAQRRGGAHEELSEALAEVVKNVLEHGKQGTLSLSLKIKPVGDGQVQIVDAIKVGAPEGEKAPSIFYSDENGNVSRSDPRQTEMPLKQVGSGEAVAASA